LLEAFLYWKSIAEACEMRKRPAVLWGCGAVGVWGCGACGVVARPLLAVAREDCIRHTAARTSKGSVFIMLGQALVLWSCG
jgi:hypothetical protein